MWVTFWVTSGRFQMGLELLTTSLRPASALGRRKRPTTEGEAGVPINDLIRKHGIVPADLLQLASKVRRRWRLRAPADQGSGSRTSATRVRGASDQRLYCDSDRIICIAPRTR